MKKVWPRGKIYLIATLLVLGVFLAVGYTRAQSSPDLKKRVDLTEPWGEIDLGDLRVMLSDMSNPANDFNGDGSINLVDGAILFANAGSYQLVTPTPSPSLTPTPTSTVTRFAAYGDSRNGHTVHQKISQRIAAANVDFSLHTGDIVNYDDETCAFNGSGASTWAQFQEDAALICKTKDGSRSCNQASEYLDSNYYPVPGNHEFINSCYNDYFENFPFLLNDTDRGANWWNGGHRSYSFVRGSTFFLMLDSSGGAIEDTDHKAWINSRLGSSEAQSAKFIVVTFHHPPYSTSERGGDGRVRSQWLPMFRTHGVDLVFNGHDHHYQRNVESSITYVIAGGGGASLYDVDVTLPSGFTQEAKAEKHNYVLVEVDGDVLRATAHDENGAQFDSFTLSSGTESTPTPTPTASPPPAGESVVKLGSYFNMPGDSSTYKDDVAKPLIQKGYRNFTFHDKSWTGDKAKDIKDAARDLGLEDEVDVLLYKSFIAAERGDSNCFPDVGESIYGENCSVVTANPQWFLTRSDGERYFFWRDCPTCDYSNVALNPNLATGWPQEWIRKSMERVLDVSGSPRVEWDGVFGDDLWFGLYDSWHPEDWDTYSNNAQWQATLDETFTETGRIRDQIAPGKEIWYNLGSGHRAQEGLWERWLSNGGVDGLMEEHFAQTSDRMYWKRDIERQAYAKSIGKEALAVWFMHAATYEDRTEMEWDKQAMFGFPSYLLGANGNTYFSFNHKSDRWPKWYDIFGFDFGSPVDSTMKCSPTAGYPDYCYREFENALVIVNPLWSSVQGWDYDQEINNASGRSGTVTVSVSGSYDLLDENANTLKTVSGSVEVPRFTGVILRKR